MIAFLAGASPRAGRVQRRDRPVDEDYESLPADQVLIGVEHAITWTAASGAAAKSDTTLHVQRLARVQLRGVNLEIYGENGTAAGHADVADGRAEPEHEPDGRARQRRADRARTGRPHGVDGGAALRSEPEADLERRPYAHRVTQRGEDLTGEGFTSDEEFRNFRHPATATTGQARATILSERSAEPGVMDTTIVDAAQINVAGERLFRGLGDAVMTRDSLRASGFVIEYDQDSGVLVVTGNGLVEVPGYELRGDSITATVAEGDEIRDVLARHSTSLHSADMQVTAPALRLFFEDGEVARMVALPWEPAVPGTPVARATAVNDQFRMEADSLDVLAPGQRIEEVAAVGSAYVERFTPDSLQALLPETDDDVRSLIANDWVRGDTVRAYFTDGPPPDEEGAAVERVLERLWAGGEPARTMHRTRDRNAEPDVLFSLAYLVGRKIDVTFRDGAIAVVTASEDVRGVYLQPSDVAARTTGSNTGRPPPRQQ
jgi:hypothetical protein